MTARQELILMRAAAMVGILAAAAFAPVIAVVITLVTATRG